jgi:hypothetical protein
VTLADWKTCAELVQIVVNTVGTVADRVEKRRERQRQRKKKVRP